MRLFSVVFAGLLAVGSLTAAMEDVQGTVEVMPDGSKVIRGEDGTTIEVHPDGSKLIKKPNGTMIQIMPDGSKTIKTRGSQE